MYRIDRSCLLYSVMYVQATPSGGVLLWVERFRYEQMADLSALATTLSAISGFDLRLSETGHGVLQ